jgi:hypothetical protein
MKKLLIIMIFTLMASSTFACISKPFSVLVNGEVVAKIQGNKILESPYVLREYFKNDEGTETRTALEGLNGYVLWYTKEENRIKWCLWKTDGMYRGCEKTYYIPTNVRGLPMPNGSSEADLIEEERNVFNVSC